MPKASVKDCVVAIQQAAKKRTIGDDEAAKLLADIKERARKRAVKKFISETDAIKEIGDELTVGLKYEEARSKLNSLRNIRAFREVNSYIQKQSGRKNNYALGVERFLQTVKDTIIGLKTQYEYSYLSKLEEAGLIDVIKNRDSQWDLDFRKELQNLNRKDGKADGVTGNSTALKAAQIWHPINAELLALQSRQGARIATNEDYSVSQTHLREKLLNAEKKRFGTSYNQDNAYKVWKEHIDTLNVDWDRMDLGGVEPEKWLREFFRNIYNRKFDQPGDIDLDAGKGGNLAMADRTGHQRKLWFKDAESEQKYDQAFGLGDAFGSTFATIRHATRLSAILQKMGPNPDKVFDKTINQLEVDAKTLSNSDEVISNLKQGMIPRMYQTITGESDSTIRPTWSRLTDIAKASTLLSKGTKFVVSALGDKFAADTAMKYQGLKLADRMRMHFEAMRVRDKEKSGKVLRDVYAVTQAYIMELNGFNHDNGMMKRSQLLNRMTRLTEFQFKYTGFTGLTDMHHRAPAYAYAQALGEEVGKGYYDVRPEMQRAFELHGIIPAEWDAWSKYSITGKDLDDAFDGTWLTPDRLDDFTNEDWGTIVQAKGEKVNPSSIARARDEFNAKTRALFHYIVSDANNDPTLRVQSMKAIGGQRGNISREAWEMFMMFKSYPLTQLDRHLNREYLRTGASSLGDYLQGNPGSAMLKAAEIAGKGMVAGLMVIWLNDLINGKTPKTLVEQDGTINEKLLLAAAQRGGGLGIYGDFLFGEYDRRYNNPLETLAGPILGQLPVAASFKQDVVGEGKPGYKTLKMFQDNAPLINLPLIKPVLDHLIFFQMQEMLNPGIHARRAAEMRRLGYQDYLGIMPTPTESVQDDPLGVQSLFE